jgi:hypothetical protein
MAPSLLIVIARRVLIYRKVLILMYSVYVVLLSLITISLISTLIRSSDFLSFLVSYPVSFRLFLYLPLAFCTYLIFYYPARCTRHHSRLFILIATGLFFPAYWIRSCIRSFFFFAASPRFSGMSLLIEKVVGILLLSYFILQPRFTALHLTGTGLLLILIFSFYSLLLLLPVASVNPLTGLSVLVFLYYFPRMPNFFLSFAPIIRRTMGIFLLFFLILTPRLVTFFQQAAAYAFILIATPQTRIANFVVRRLHETGYMKDYGEADWFIRLLTWSFFTLYVIFTVAKILTHPVVL